MRDLAAQIINQSASNSGLIYQPLPQDDPRQRQPDISLAQRVLGWSPIVGLRDGLERTVADLRQRIFATAGQT